MEDTGHFGKDFQMLTGLILRSGNKENQSGRQTVGTVEINAVIQQRGSHNCLIQGPALGMGNGTPFVQSCRREPLSLHDILEQKFLVQGFPGFFQGVNKNPDQGILIFRFR